MELSKRQLAVLSEVVELYISTGKPVASRQVARHSGLGLSPASIRGVMADLEDKGLLTRAHASAGCIPTDLSFRFYVNAMCPGRRLPSKLRNSLGRRFAASKRELLEDLEWVARLVADVTSEAGVAMRPMDEEPELEAVTLIPLGGCRVLAVLVTADGSVEKRVIKLGEDLSRADLQRVANILSTRFQGSSLDRIRNTISDQDLSLDDAANGDRERWQELVKSIGRKLFAAAGEDVEVLVAGADNLLRAEDFADGERLRSLMAVLHDRGRLVREWRRGFHRGRTQIIIGRESEITADGNLGMVATLFFRGGRRAGALGVVGPRRMNYGRIVPVVEYIGNTLTQMLEESGARYA
jgi:heat-inducible transcriptional repressor